MLVVQARATWSLFPLRLLDAKARTHVAWENSGVSEEISAVEIWISCTEGQGNARGARWQEELRRK